MIFNARKRFRRKKAKSKIDTSTVVCSDDILLFDLIEQLILMCCCSVFQLTYDDFSDVSLPIAKKPQTIDKKLKNP